MAPQRHIFCLGANARAVQIARDLGWEAGARSDYTLYDCARPLALLDIDWKRPDWARHLRVARGERPWLAAVPDVETEGQLPGALAQAEELAPWCENLLLIPKAPVIDAIPTHVGGKPVILGYSVPTAYGGTGLFLWEFGRRPVHLLGGRPRAQQELCSYLNVVSLDGNAAWQRARWGDSFDRHGFTRKRDRLPKGESEHGPLEALRRSLTNLRAFWGLPALERE